MKTGLVDYGRGNLRSVEKALQKVGADVLRVNNPDSFPECDVLVLPGVGSFGDAMQNLSERGLVLPLKHWLNANRPFLGICLGYQLLFEEGEESPGVSGLGWLPGKVVRFPASVGKVPHIGWNTIEEARRRDSLFSGLAGDAYFYHVHSFYPDRVVEEDVACYTEYGGIRFASGVSKGNVHAFQFHPEKSQSNGLMLLAQFIRRSQEALV